jgi:hypothetical protein
MVKIYAEVLIPIISIGCLLTDRSFPQAYTELLWTTNFGGGKHFQKDKSRPFHKALFIFLKDAILGLRADQSFA